MLVIFYMQEFNHAHCILKLGWNILLFIKSLGAGFSMQKVGAELVQGRLWQRDGSSSKMSLCLSVNRWMRELVKQVVGSLNSLPHAEQCAATDPVLVGQPIVREWPLTRALSPTNLISRLAEPWG